MRIMDEAEDKADEGAQQAQTIAEQATEIADGVVADIRAEWQGFDVKVSLSSAAAPANQVHSTNERFLL